VANNRMFLTNGKVKIFIAKYYPSTGWYTKNDGLISEIDKAFNDDDFGRSWKKGMKSKYGMCGHADWKIVYEVEKDK